MSPQRVKPPLYDRRRLAELVMEHRVRVHLEQKKKHRQNTGVKAPR